MIRIVNWLLTRRCNLKCDYCAIVRDSKCLDYPRIDHYYKNEMHRTEVIEAIQRLQLHNPDCFHIFYGGEPTIYKYLPEVIKYCNEYNVNYTIITNNTASSATKIEKLFEAVGGDIRGLTSSVDPIIFVKSKDIDRKTKAFQGLARLIDWKSKVKDCVAEITISNDNIEYVEALVRLLDSYDISSSITFVDIAKNDYYDFSNVTDESQLIHKSDGVRYIIDNLLNSGLNVHMGEELVNQIYNILPANYNCNLEHSFHNMTIDADGSVRTCLRCRGIETPKLKIFDYINEDGILSDELIRSNIMKDKQMMDCSCNWTCPMMSNIIEENENRVVDLLHK